MVSATGLVVYNTACSSYFLYFVQSSRQFKEFHSSVSTVSTCCRKLEFINWRDVSITREKWKGFVWTLAKTMSHLLWCVESYGFFIQMYIWRASYVHMFCYIQYILQIMYWLQIFWDYFFTKRLPDETEN
jgi:hypothetical protein